MVAASHSADALLGLIMLSHHSKALHLENLAAATIALGIGPYFVHALIQVVGYAGLAMLSLTPAISDASTFGYHPSGQLADVSIAVLIPMPDTTVFKSLT